MSALRRLSAYHRRIAAMGKGSFVPADMPSRQFYTVMYGVLIAVAFFGFGLSGPLQFGTFETFLFVYVPTWAAAGLAAVQLAGMHFWHKTPKAKPGEFPAYTLKDYNKWRRLRPFLYRSKDGESRIITFEMCRGGGIDDVPVDGNGPVVVAPILQRDVDEALTQEYAETQQIPTLPEGRADKLGAGTWMGSEYIIPGDFEPNVLGNDDDDGLPRDVRRWVRQNYADLTPLATVLMAWENMPQTELIANWKPTVRQTNYHWALADAHRHVKELEDENMRLRKRSAKGRELEWTGVGTAVQVSEEEVERRRP